MSSMKIVLTKKKMIRRDQLGDVLGNGGVMRRSPRFKQPQLSSHSIEDIQQPKIIPDQVTRSAARRALFSPKQSIPQEGLVGSAHASQSATPGSAENSTSHPGSSRMQKKPLSAQVSSLVTPGSTETTTIHLGSSRMQKKPLSAQVTPGSAEAANLHPGQRRSPRNAKVNNASKRPQNTMIVSGGTEGSANVAAASETTPISVTPTGEIHGESANTESEQTNASQLVDGLYDPNSRRRIRAMMPINEKGRGCNKTKLLKQRVFVEVNEHGQAIGDSQRALSSYLGCLAHDPRRLPLDVKDWRLLDKKFKESIWEEVKLYYYFPENQEPFYWVMEKLHESWRGYKNSLKVHNFDGRTYEEAIARRPREIPTEMWQNMVDLWNSKEGQERSRRGVENRKKRKMNIHSGSKTHARIRAEIKAQTGEEPDELTMFLKTHEPKDPSTLDDATVAAKKLIEDKLAALPEDMSTDHEARNKIYKEVVGEDNYGYAKTFGLGVKVPRSLKKRCALEEERAKRVKSEQKVEILEKELGETKEGLLQLTNLVKTLMRQQGHHVDEDNVDDNINADENVGATGESDFDISADDME